MSPASSASSSSSSSSSVQRCWPWAFFSERMYLKGSERSAYVHEHMLFKNTSCSRNDLMTSPSMYTLPLPNSHEPRGPSPSYDIKATDNGLVLYASHDLSGLFFPAGVNGYFICNPVTMQWCALPEPKYPFRRSNAWLITQVERGTLRSYRVVLVCCCDGYEQRRFLEFEVFSSETGKWEEYDVPSQFVVTVRDHQKVTVLKGILHWEDSVLGGVVAYDPYNSPDKFRIIGFPAELDKSRDFWMSSSRCGAQQGHLKLFEATNALDPQWFSHLKIWVLEDYNSDRWHLEHVVRRQDITLGDGLHCRSPDINLASFHPYDADIVYLQCGKEVISYNLRTRRLERTACSTCPESYRSFLVHPLWPISIPTSLYRDICPWTRSMWSLWFTISYM